MSHHACHVAPQVAPGRHPGHITPPMDPVFSHRLVATDGAARAGVLDTAHGPVETPVFMPVGTAGTVKAMTADAVRATGARIVLGNTYHLMLRPGAERVARLGGLHRFMDWPGPILTDSGGFQVMSLAKLRKIDADGVTFRSHLDGSTHRLTPARVDADPARARRHDHHGAATSARRSPPREDRGARARWSCPCAGRRGRRQAFVAAPRLRAVRHRAGQRVSGAARRLGRGADRASASTATRSAAWRSARARRRCYRVLDATRAAAAGRPAALPDGRRHAGRPDRRGGARASTCSIA